MSYSMKIVKKDGALIVEHSYTNVGHFPDAISLSGHNVKPGETGFESLSATITAPALDHSGGWDTILQLSAGRTRTVPPAGES